MKRILIFISIISCLLLCSCEQTEYTDHPNLYHTGYYYDVIKINDTIFLCIPNNKQSGGDIKVINTTGNENNYIQ